MYKWLTNVCINEKRERNPHFAYEIYQDSLKAIICNGVKAW